MTYKIKEMYFTLQGEGAHTGRPAVFCRFTGCNLWSGRERHRAKAVCQFCDTDFIGTDGPGGGRFADADTLADAIAAHWPAVAPGSIPFVVFTGGEPMLQLDTALIAAMSRRGFSIAVETNGTVPPPEGDYWITVSPKAGTTLAITRGQELKLVYPQVGAEPEKFEDLDFQYFYLQPMDGPDRQRNTQMAIEYCLKHPRWRLSLQTHKITGIA